MNILEEGFARAMAITRRSLSFQQSTIGVDISLAKSRVVLTIKASASPSACRIHIPFSSKYGLDLEINLPFLDQWERNSFWFAAASISKSKITSLAFTVETL